MHCGETPLWKRCSFNRIKSKKSIWVTCSFWNLKWETSWATQELSRTVVLSCFKCVLPFPLMKYLWKYVMDMSCLSTTHSQVQVCLANSWQQHTGCTFFFRTILPLQKCTKTNPYRAMFYFYFWVCQRFQQFHILCISSREVKTSPVTSCNETLAFYMANALWKTSVMEGDVFVFLTQNVGGNRSIWGLGSLTILKFEIWHKESIGPQKKCPGLSRFRVLRLSSLLFWWKASGNILCICLCDRTTSKFPDLARSI